MQQQSRAGFSEEELLQQVPALRSFARRFHSSPNDIDELVQETLLKALSNAEKFHRGTRLKSWLFTIMRNIFCTRYGLSKRESTASLEDCSAWPVVAPAQEWGVRGRELDSAFNALPDHYRWALELVFIQGLSYEAAASQCGCRIGTVKSRVNRAKQHLAQALGEEPHRRLN